MKRTTYQVPELRDENDNIIQAGTYGKESPLVNSTNDGVLDYINNNLMYLYDNTMGGTGGEINTETITGQTGTITTLTATTVKAGTVTADALSGPLTGNVTGTADKAIADGSGNNIVNTYVTKSGLASSVTTATGKVTTLTATDNTLTNVTITGATSVPTANAGNSSKAIANTEYVQGELTNYLPLSGGTVTGGLTVEGTITGNLAGNADTATNATNATNDANGNPIAGTYLPSVVGVVQAFAGSTTPQGWLLCDGSAVSRTDYAALYAVIGTTYGAGNGSTTFNLPNLIDKFVEGSATAGTVKSAGLPNITGTFQTRYPWNGAIVTGAFTSPTTGEPTSVQAAASTQLNYNTVSFNANKSNSIYGNSTTVQPPALTMRYIIKY